MTPGDKFTWTCRENDYRFGEKCEVEAIRGNKLFYRFVDRPNWKSAVMPLEWIYEREYSESEIAEVRARYKERRKHFRDFLTL